MNKIFIYGFLFSAFALSSASLASADAMMPNTHPVNMCAKVVNLNEFPDIVLVGSITGPMASGTQASSIENNTCFTAGYKFNSLNIYWNTKEKGAVIDSNNLLLKDAPAYGGYIDDKDPLVKQDIEYTLTQTADGKLILYKSKQISEYNNGTPAKTILFHPELPPELSPQTVQLGFWQSVWCFFQGLFGIKCT